MVSLLHYPPWISLALSYRLRWSQWLTWWYGSNFEDWSVSTASHHLLLGLGLLHMSVQSYSWSKENQEPRSTQAGHPGSTYRPPHPHCVKSALPPSVKQLIIHAKVVTLLICCSSATGNSEYANGSHSVWFSGALAVSSGAESLPLLTSRTSDPVEPRKPNSVGRWEGQ